MTAPALRPRSIPEIIDAAFHLARGHFMPLLIVSVIVAIPTLIIGAANAYLLPPPNPDDPFGEAWRMGLPLTLAGFCWTFIGYGAVTIAAADAYMGRVVDPGSSLSRALKRAGPLVLGNFLGYMVMVLPFLAAGMLAAVVAPMIASGNMGAGGSALVIGLLVFALVLFGFYWLFLNLARVTLVTPVAALEQAGAVVAWQRAKMLTDGSRLRVIGLILISGVVILGLVIGGFTLLSMLIANERLASSLAGLVGIPLWPVLGCLFVVLYYDLRIRTEAYDIEVMAAGLSEASASKSAKFP